jgi:hypothetical protein
LLAFEDLAKAGAAGGRLLALPAFDAARPENQVDCAG